MAARRTLTLGGSALRYSSENSCSIEMPRVPPRTGVSVVFTSEAPAVLGSSISPTFTTASSVVAISMPEATVSIPSISCGDQFPEICIAIFSPERLLVTQSVVRAISRIFPGSVTKNFSQNIQ